MKKSLIILFAVLLISGCRLTVIRLNVVYDPEPHAVFGMNNERTFFLNRTIPDSVIEKWTGTTNGSYNNSSVTVFNSFVFVNDLSGRISAFDINTGKRAGELKRESSIFTAAVIKDFWMIFASASEGENLSNLVFYDYNRGQEKHELEVQGRITSQLLLDKDGVIAVTEQGDIMKYDFAGNRVWFTKLKTTTHSNPALSEGIVVLGTDKGEIAGIESKSGILLYKKKIGGPIFGGVTVKEGRSFVGTIEGDIICCGLKDGSEIWRFEGGSKIMMNPAAAEEDIIFGDLAGYIYSLNAREGSMNWKLKTGGAFNAAPLVTENLILMPDLFGKLHFIERNSGAIRRSVEVDGRMKLSPVIYKNLLFVGFDRGKLRAYEILD